MGFKCFLFMLENKRDRSYVSNTDINSLRKPRFKLSGSFFSDVKNFSRRLFGLEERKLSTRLDETISKNISEFNKSMMEERPNTREEKMQSCFFQWIKTERSGDVCRFKEFVIIDATEYVVFTDETRIASSLIGDVILMHEHESSILTDLSSDREPTLNAVVPPRLNSTPSPMSSQNFDPVMSILDKSKKKSQKISISLTVKIPSVELYSIVKENFDNVDNVILDSVMQQVQDGMLKDSLKRELQVIYNTKRKSPKIIEDNGQKPS